MVFSCISRRWAAPLILLVFGGLFILCVAAVISYAVAGGAKYVVTCVFASLSAVVCVFVGWDVFRYHRSSSLGRLADDRGSGFAFLKFLFSLFLAFAGFIVFVLTLTIRSQLGLGTSAAASFWVAIGTLAALAWSIDLGYNHVRQGEAELPKTDTTPRNTLELPDKS